MTSWRLEETGRCRRRIFFILIMIKISTSSAFKSRRLVSPISRSYASSMTHKLTYQPKKYDNDAFRFQVSRSTSGCNPMLFSSSTFEMTSNEIQMKDDALKMINASIRAVDPYAAIKRKMMICTDEDSSETLVIDGVNDGETQIKYDMSKYDRIRVFSFGKASAAMAKAAGEIISSSGKQLDGVTIIKDDHATAQEIQLLKEKYNIVVRPASHPVPDARSVAASNEILQLAKNSDSRTLVVACISGGGSALFCSPREPLTLDDLMQTNSALLASGMPIEKMNVIRKRLENGKGGNLAATAFPATVLTLVLSDIIGDPIDLIASGPTVPDDGNGWDEACRLVQEYRLDENGEYALPEAVLNVLRLGRDGQLEDTPKSTHPAFCDSPPLCQTVLVGNNRAAVMAAANEAEKLGYNPVVLGTRIDGEASVVAGTFVAMAEILSQQRELNDMKGRTVNSYPIAKLPAALIAGGETVVTIPAECNGKGGRNQELALSAAIKLKEIGLRDVVIASCGTDGTDGPTDAAGAIVDGASAIRIEETNSGLSSHDALKNHDAYHFFRTNSNDDSSHHLIQTGPTNTNVADVMITLIK